MTGRSIGNVTETTQSNQGVAEVPQQSGESRSYNNNLAIPSRGDSGSQQSQAEPQQQVTQQSAPVQQAAASQVQREQPVTQTSQTQQPQRMAMPLSAEQVAQSTQQQQPQASLQPSVQQATPASTGGGSGYSGPEAQRIMQDLSIDRDAVRVADASTRGGYQSAGSVIRNSEVDAMEREAGIQPSSQPTSNPIVAEQEEERQRQGSLWMRFPQKKPQRGKHISSSRAGKAEKDARKKAPQAEISQKMFKGTAIYGQITGDRSVPLDHISIGSEIVGELLNLPNSGFLAYIIETTGVEVTDDAMTQVTDAVRSVDVPVGVFKSPNLEPESACQLYLSIHDGRDIRLHPAAAKKFNADFDGDAVTVSFKERVIRRLPDPARFIVNLAGDLTLDMDFFPRYMGRGGIVDPAHRDKVIEQGMNGTFDFIESSQVRRSLSEKMADVYFDNSEDSMREFVNAMARAATDQNGRLDTKTMSDVLTRMFDDLKALQMMQAAEGQQHFLLEEMPKPVRLEDRRLFDFTEALLDEVLVKARGTKNFQDLRVMLCDYLGEPEKTNPSFRFTANVAKMFVNIDSRVQIGSDVEVGTDEMLDGILRYVESRKISNQLGKSESAKSSKELMKEIIMLSVGFPNQYNSFSEFIARFVEVYRRNEAIIEAADMEIMTDMGFGRRVDYSSKAKDSIGRNPTAGSIARVFLDIYGDYRMSFIFTETGFAKDEAKLRKGQPERYSWHNERVLNVVYGSRTLREFSQENKLKLDQREFQKAKQVTLFDSQGRVSRDFDAELLRSIADMRSSGASTFNKSMFGKDADVDGCVMDRLRQTLRSIDAQLGRSRTSRDWSAWVSDMVDLVNEVNPDVFSYFNMDNADGFFQSKYGSEMMVVIHSNLNKRQQVERLGSIYLAMVAEYRMARVSAQAAKVAALESDVNYSVEEFTRLLDAQHAAEDMLASSSAVWRTIVRELRTAKGERFFDRLKAGQVPFSSFKLNFDGWKSLSHESIYDVLLDTRIPRTEKCNIVSDVVRWSERFSRFNSFEVAAQLHRDTASVYSTLPPTSVGIMDAMNEFNESFDKFAKRSWRAMREQVDKAYSKFGKTPGALTNALGFYAKNPECFIEMDEMSFSDALCSILDKTYDQSEKSKQHPWTNAFYSMMCQVRNFGFFSDVYRTDDRALGLVSADQLSAYDIVTLLSDGDKVMHVYTSRGEVVYLTRDTLLGVENATEQDIWNFLKDNPRIASCLRGHRSCVTSDGNGFIGATTSISQFISDSTAKTMHGESIEERKIRYHLYDHPSYAALVGICVPTGDKLSRTLRGEYAKVDKALRKELAYMALHEVTASSMLKKLHLTPEEIMQADVSEDEALMLSALVEESLTKLSEEIRPIVTSASPSGYAFTAPDLQSCFSYYDIRQELTGSKTAVSTGIEGSETWKLATFIAALQPEDRYADLLSLSDITDVDDEALMEQFGSCMTQFGVTVSELDRETLYGGEEIVIEVPEGFTVPDKTLDSYGRQVSSACAYLIVKRDAGAEKFNLKAKKTGRDRKDRVADSVTKHGKYFTDEELAQFDFQTDNYNDLLDEINSIYVEDDPTSLFQAKMVIARHLQKANELCGYSEMTLANCMSLADLLVVADDSGGLKLRSIEMIAKAIKSRISYELIETGNADDFRQLARQAAMEAGQESVDVDEVVSNIRPATRVFGRSSIVRPRSSSWERNVNLLQRIAESTGVAPLSEKEARDNAQPFIKQDDFIGKMASDAGFHLLGINGQRVQNPGPNTLWYLDEDASASVVKEAIDDAWRYGVSVMVPNSVLLTSEGRRVAEDAVPFPGDDSGMYSLIPFFEMRLNGYESSPTPPRFGVFRRPADNIVWSYEDSMNEFSLGDAGIQFFKNLVDRIKVKWSDTTAIQSSNLFANVYAAYPDAEFTVRQTTLEELSRISRGLDEIDVGVAPEGRGFEQHWQMTMDAVDRYIEELPSFAEDNGMRKDAKPGDVVMFATIEIRQMNSTKVLKAHAPIIPFDLQGTNGVSREAVPSKFHIDSHSFEWDTTPAENAILLNWTYTDEPTSHVFKFFEGQGNANKFLAAAKTAVEGLTFRNGIPIDAAYAPESTASRRIGTNKRIGTLQTLMFMARTEGYNFAEQRDSFPYNPDLKESLLAGYVPLSEWKALISDDFRWHKDDKINSFVKHEVKKFMLNGGNPTDFLCSRFGDANTDVWWEFECMFEASRTYQDCLMAFLHSMNENLCAGSIDDSSEGYLFRCMPNDASNPFATHCMAMQVPHADPQGGYYYRWENVYAGWSFLNFNDFSGAHRINVNGSSDMLDAVATLALSGRTPDLQTYRAWLRSSLSDVGDMRAQSSIISIDARDPFANNSDDDGSQEQ